MGPPFLSNPAWSYLYLPIALAKGTVVNEKMIAQTFCKTSFPMNPIHQQRFADRSRRVMNQYVSPSIVLVDGYDVFVLRGMRYQQLLPGC